MPREMSADRRVVEAKIASWIRKHTAKKKEFFFLTRDLFDGIGLDYDSKEDYRAIMDIIHQWRRQAPFFYHTMLQEGELTGKTIYSNFEQFLLDWNEIGMYFLWNKTIEAKDGSKLFGYYQPTSAEEKIRIDSSRNGKTIKQLKNRFADMVLMNNQPLPSGYSPELALESIERFERKYLLSKGETTNQTLLPEGK